MDLPVNTFKRALIEGRCQIGFWAGLASHVAVEIVAGAGFDWIVIDAEHGPNDVPLVHMQLQAAATGTAHLIVRPAWNDVVLIKRYLDVGVQTLLVPYVQTAEEAAQAVAATRYPPRGVRGFAVATRASRFGRIDNYHTRYEQELCVIVQVETKRALDNIETIARVDGVNGVFIGPGDLAADLGHVGNPSHPDVQAAIEDAIRRIQAAPSVAGILTTDERLARRYLELGCLFTAVGSDVGLLARGAEQLAAKFRAATSTTVKTSDTSAE
jgi:4-hydroxy-2-oxoheptanedioate aldolase